MKKLAGLIIGIVLLLGIVSTTLKAEEIKSEAKFSVFKATSIVGYSFLSDEVKTWTGGGINLKDEKFAIGGALENESPIQEAGIFATVNITSYESMEWYAYLKDKIILFFLPEEVKPYVANDYGIIGLCNWEGKTRGGVGIVVDIVKIPLPLPWLKK